MTGYSGELKLGREQKLFLMPPRKSILCLAAVWRRLNSSTCRRCSSIPTLPTTMACKADTGFAAPLFEMVQFGAFVVWVTNYVVTATQCVGPSMLPTIDTGGDVVLMLSMRLLRFFRLHRPRMGDVVISTSPTNPNQTICKRVLGVAGDTIPLRPGGIGHCDRYAIVVPAGHVWLQVSARCEHELRQRCHNQRP